LADLINHEDFSAASQISLLPIDKNANGKIDHFESIYEDLNKFSRGVWIGKYPNELVANIYSITVAKPENKEAKAFLKWVLSDGQQYMLMNGFSELIGSERQSKIEKLTDPVLYPYAPVDKYAGWKTGVIVFLVLMLFVILFRSIFLYKKYEKKEQMAGTGKSASVFNETSVEAPGGLLYDKSHTWVFMEKDGSVKIGIDGFLPKITGKITEIKMMNPGKKVNKGDVMMTLIQNGKKLLVKAPISGTIKEQNDDLYSNSMLINSSPYAEGWVYIVEPSNWLREIQFLFRAEKFKTWLKAEFLRLKDFFAITLSNSEVKPAYLILQEGGELKEGLLTEFGPVVWEDFQTNFIEKTA
jgi:glycine cleavage system H lipoate-binding protein